MKYGGIIWELEGGIVLGMLEPPGMAHQKGWGGTEGQVTEHSRWSLLTPNLAWAGPALRLLTLTAASLRNLAGKR